MKLCTRVVLILVGVVIGFGLGAAYFSTRDTAVVFKLDTLSKAISKQQAKDYAASIIGSTMAHEQLLGIFGDMPQTRAIPGQNRAAVMEAISENSWMFQVIATAGFASVFSDSPEVRLASVHFLQQLADCIAMVGHMFRNYFQEHGEAPPPEIDRLMPQFSSMAEASRTEDEAETGTDSIEERAAP